ncbi:MAG: putative S-layer protein [Candidatus Nanoarchaeia archaeon]
MKRLLLLLALLAVIPSALAFTFDLPPSITFAEDGSATLDLIAGGYLTLGTGESIVSYTFSGNTNVICAGNTAKNVLTFSAKANWNGVETITVNATNNSGQFITDTITVTVTPTDDPPVLNVSASLKAYADVPFSLQLSATDPDQGATFFYSAATDWTTFSMSPSGLISFTPTVDDIGLHFVKLTVTDNTGLNNTKEVKFLVTDVTDDGSLIFSDWELNDITGDDSVLVPGDKIEVNFELKNKLTIDINNIEVKGWIEDSSGKRITDRIKLAKFDLSGDDTESDTITLTVPIDTTESTLYLFVRAEGEDDNDIIRSVLNVERLKLEREDHDIAFESVTITPDLAICGQSVDLIVNIWNVGAKDEDVKLHVTNSDLKIDVYSELFKLDNKGDNREAVKTISISLNDDIKPGNYSLTVTASYNSGKASESTNVPLNIECASYVPGAEKVSTGALTLSESSVSGKPGVELEIEATIKNTGNEDATYAFELVGISDWASGSIRPGTVTLSPGKEANVIVSIIPKSTASGEHKATINVKSGGMVVDSKEITVKLGAKPGITITPLNLSGDNTTLLFLVLIGVLAALTMIVVGKRLSSNNKNVQVYGSKKSQ